MKSIVKPIKLFVVATFFITSLILQMFVGVATTSNLFAAPRHICPDVGVMENENELKQQTDRVLRSLTINNKTRDSSQGIGETDIPVISVVNPVTGENIFTFNAGITRAGTRFNATVWVYNVTNLFGYQVRLIVNDTLLNITRVWIPYWDSKWVFYGLPYLPLDPVLYDKDLDGIHEDALFASCLLGTYTFSGSGLLAIVEFGIVYVPISEEASSELNIDNSDTMLLDRDAIEITANKMNGLYIIRIGRQHLALYAGSSNPGIVYEYAGNSEWYAISQSLGTTILCLAVWNGELYAGTTTGSAGMVYRYDGFEWRLIAEFPERQVSSLVVWNGELYAGTTSPANLYRYDLVTGNWDLVLSNALPNGIRVMYVWERDNALYLGDYNSDTIGRYDGANYAIVAEYGRSCIWDFQSYGEYLYASAWRGYLYRSSNGFNWETVLINPEARNIWALEEFQGYLYLGMDWTGSGPSEAQLWRYDGSTGELIWSIPVNDRYQGIISMATDGLHLYLGLGGEEGYYQSGGVGQVYRYDGMNIELISGIMGEGVQCLLFAGSVQRPEHDIAVYLQVPNSLPVAYATTINVTVYNNGIFNETSVEIYLQINAETKMTETIAHLNSGSVYTLSYQWTPELTGVYNITAIVPPVNGENITKNNRATKLVWVGTIPSWLKEGRYANYLFLPDNSSQPPTLWMKYNITYVRYVDPTLINVTISMETSDGYINRMWMIVNVLTREVIGTSQSYYIGKYFFGWIETNITIGSTVRLFDTNGTVIGEEIVKAAGKRVNCWVIEITMYTYDSAYHYTFWYDKITGLWVGVRIEDYSGSSPFTEGWLVETNVPIGGALRVETDKFGYARGEIVTVTAIYEISGVPVEGATITFQVNYPNGTLYFIWTAATDANGTATIQFLIEETAPVGMYTVSATSYKPGYDPQSGYTAFLVAYFEPRLTLWFEGPEVAVVGLNSTIVLHVENCGNATAYNVIATLNVPITLTVVWANMSFVGTIDPGEEVRLVVVVTAASPESHLLTGYAEYYKADGTMMPPVYAEKFLAFGYHENYPVDLVDARFVYSPGLITVNMSVTNYGRSPVQITLIVSAQHIETKLMLRSSYVTIMVNPSETISIDLAISIPDSAPSGEYMVKAILASDLPSNEGFTLTEINTIITT